MRYLVAVSGGVDSVVLLDMLVASGEHELTVAHFDHGIRSDSAEDARFVAGLAAQYGLPFVCERKELGIGASEERARHYRYAFLKKMAEEYEAEIATAHHQNDVIETIAINVKRGTGWRGVAVMQTAGVVRPLLEMTKSDIRAYALKHRLEWVEDGTNASDRYLRNQLRRRIGDGPSVEQKALLLKLWQSQLHLKTAIDGDVASLLRVNDRSRYFFSQIDEKTAIELLRGLIIAKTRVSPTRPQLARAVLAIKTARPGTTFEIGDGVKLLFSVRSFIVETP